MPRPIVIMRKRLRAPAGCDDYLTRRQAAAILGFASEYKIRELERQGILRSVRGPMRTAFYPRPEVLALKAKLAQAEAGQELAESWSDADLIALLAHPKSTGQPRTALDLVTETRISIERAERVYTFCSKGAQPSAVPPPLPQTTPAVEAAVEPTSPSPTAADTDSERRGPDRLTRDKLIRDLRDPDPRVRQQAFECLRDAQGQTGLDRARPG